MLDAITSAPPPRSVVFTTSTLPSPPLTASRHGRELDRPHRDAEPTRVARSVAARQERAAHEQDPVRPNGVPPLVGDANREPVPLLGERVRRNTPRAEV